MKRSIVIILLGVGCCLPRVSVAAATTVTVTVDANANSISRSSASGGTCTPGSAGCPTLVDTGLNINARDVIQITAVGTWTISGADPYTNANGQTGRPCHSGVDWPCSSLLGQISDVPLQIGDAGVFEKTFFVGKNFSQVSSLAGRLFLAFNDTDYGNNAGSVTATVTANPDSAPTPLIGTLENPPDGSYQSGISVISGWHCTASRIDLQIDGGATVRAAYGTPRVDTIPVCGDDGNNGFGFLINWNLLGNASHTIVALADGVEFGRATFTVTTLEQEFLRGASGTYFLNFNGRNVTVQWQESLQNFVIVGVQ